MSQPKSIAALFTQEPPQWGLRGDPFLWREMRLRFEQTPMPDTGDGLIALLESTFKSLTGHSVSESQPFFVERFSHGGMSSGQISPEFWRDMVIPMMRDRYAEA